MRRPGFLQIEATRTQLPLSDFGLKPWTARRCSQTRKSTRNGNPEVGEWGALRSERKVGRKEVCVSLCERDC